MRQLQQSSVASAFIETEDNEISSSSSFEVNKLRDELREANEQLEAIKQQQSSPADQSDLATRADIAEKELAASRARVFELTREVDDLSAQLLSSDEAEQAKKH